jgi:hypothetical protein
MDWRKAREFVKLGIWLRISRRQENKSISQTEDLSPILNHFLLLVLVISYRDGTVKPLLSGRLGGRRTCPDTRGFRVGGVP